MAEWLSWVEAHWVPLFVGGIVAFAAIAAIVRGLGGKGSIKALRDFEARQRRAYSKAESDLADVTAKIQRDHGNAMVVDLVHDLGYPFMPLDREGTPRGIEFEQAMEVMNRVRSAKDGPLVVILHTLGGYSLPTEFIAASLKGNKGRVTAYVPYVAMSGGTIVALACDEIRFGKNAALGPIDTQYYRWNFDAYQKLVDFKKGETDDPYLLNYYQAQMREKTIVGRLEHVARNESHRAAVAKLIKPELGHDRRITMDDAKTVYRLHVSDAVPKEIYEFVELRLLMMRHYNETILESIREHMRGRGNPPEGKTDPVPMRVTNL